MRMRCRLLNEAHDLLQDAGQVGIGADEVQDQILALLQQLGILARGDVAEHAVQHRRVVDGGQTQAHFMTDRHAVLVHRPFEELRLVHKGSIDPFPDVDALSGLMRLRR